MASVPTVLEKLLDREYIPIEYEEYTEQRCFGGTPPAGEDPGSGPECVTAITRTVEVAQGGGLTLDPGEFIFQTFFLEGTGVRYVLARLECSP